MKMRVIQQTQHVMTVNMIGQHMVLSVVIQQLIHLVLTVLHLKVHTDGIVLDVIVL